MDDWALDGGYFQPCPPLESGAPLPAQPSNHYYQANGHGSQGLDGLGPERGLLRLGINGTIDKNYWHAPSGDDGREPLRPGLGNANTLLLDKYHGHDHGRPVPGFFPPQPASSYSRGPGDAPSLTEYSNERPTTTTSLSEAPSGLAQVDHYRLPCLSAHNLKPAPEAPGLLQGTSDAGLTPHGWDTHGAPPLTDHSSQETQCQIHADQQVRRFATSGGPGGNAAAGVLPDLAKIHALAGPGAYPEPDFPREELLDPATSSQADYSNGAVDNLEYYQPPHSGGVTSLSFLDHLNGGVDDPLFGVGGAGDLPPGLLYDPAFLDNTEEAHGSQDGYINVAPVGQHLPSLPSWGETPAWNENIQTRHYRPILPATSAPSNCLSASVSERASEAATPLPLPGTGRGGSRSAPYPQSRPQNSAKRGDRASQRIPTQFAIVDSPPARPPPAGAERDQLIPKGRGKRNGKMAEGKGKAAQDKKDERSVCTTCRYSKVNFEMTSGQICVACKKKEVLCTPAYFRDLFLGDSSLPPFTLSARPDYLPGTMLGGDVVVAALAGKVDELYRPGHDIRATSADGNLNVVLDMEGVSGRLRQLELTSPYVSLSKPANDDRILKCLVWSVCVMGQSSHTCIDVLASLYRVWQPVTFAYVNKGSHSTGVCEIEDPGHNRALGELFCILRRNLEIETWEAIHDWLYKHKDMGKPKPEKKKGKTGKTRKRKAKAPRSVQISSNVLSFAVHLLSLLFALRQHFQSLDRGPIKWRVGELCKRLYSYYFILKEKPPKLSEEDARSLPERLRVGRDELPSKEPLSAFYAWVGASDGDVQWWENASEEKWYS